MVILNGSYLFIFQLLGVIGAGGFIGEFYRVTYSGGSIDRFFIANYLAGSFLSFMISYGIYLLINNKNLSLVLAGILAYQDEKYLTKISHRFLKDFIKGSDNK